MKVVGYVRVSGRLQVEEGLGLEVQEEAIRSWCLTHDHELVAIQRDEGISGAKETVARPGLGAALLAVEEGQAEALVVYRLDRLARQLLIQETVISMLGKAGRSVLSVQEADIDDGDPTRVLLRQVLGAISQYERAVIAARMAAGRAAKAARGGYAGFGSPAFGQRSIDKKLVADEAEQAAVTRILELRDEGLSLREIIARLDAEGIPAKRGGGWSPSTVSRVLARAGRQ